MRMRFNMGYLNEFIISEITLLQSIGSSFGKVVADSDTLLNTVSILIFSTVVAKIWWIISPSKWFDPLDRHRLGSTLDAVRVSIISNPSFTSVIVPLSLTSDRRSWNWFWKKNIVKFPKRPTLDCSVVSSEAGLMRNGLDSFLYLPSSLEDRILR